MKTDLETLSARAVLPDGTYDAHFINEYGRIESLRSSRYNTHFSVVVASLEGGAAPLNEGSALRLLAASVLEAVRNCDVVGVDEDGRVIAILPETDYFGSLTTIRKLKRASTEITRKYPHLSMIFSHATFPADGRGFGELIATASRRADEKRNSLLVTMGLKKKLFWEVMGDLLNSGARLQQSACFDAGSGYPLNESFLEQINEVIVRDVARSPRKRGILYLSPKKIAHGEPVIKSLGDASKFKTNVFIVGEVGETRWDIKNATALGIEDPRMRDISFTFYLSEDSGYAIISKENWGATFSCFHTSDPYLVEGLITKFQNEYSLQEQLG